MSPMLIGVSAVLVLAALVRRFRGTPLSAGELFGTPVILVIIGGYIVHSDVGLTRLTVTDSVWLTMSLAVGLAFGAVRGTTVRLASHEGSLLQRYTGRTVVVWLASLAGNAAVSALAGSSGMHPEVKPMVLSLGVGLLGEALTLGIRALATGLPFAPDERNDSDWTNRLVASLRQAYPVTPPSDGHLRHSPTLRESIGHLTRRH